MLKFIARRLVWTAPTALLVIVVVFSILQLAPGDAARLVAGEDASGETVELIRHQLGLDRPIPEQFLLYVSNLVRLDLGRSLFSQRELVRDEIANAFPATLQLASLSLLIAVLLGVPIGLYTAVHRGTLGDLVGTVLAVILSSAPSFWLGLMLMLLFAVILGWLPVAGSGGPEFLTLPALTLAGNPLALIARLVRSECLEVLGLDYIRTARGKGLSENVVLYRYVLRNALLPVLTVVGLQFGVALGGAVVVESVFAWPGVGRLVVNALSHRDFPVVQGGVLVIALGFVLVNLLVDIAYFFADPRMREG